MATGALISVEEYLHTSYSPDVEYVDGELVEINVGDPLHSMVQSNLIYFLRSKYPQLKVMPEVRSRTSTTRFRLPDVAVTFHTPAGRFITDAPFIAIEILSEEDRMSRVIEKLKEYAAMGIPNIWVVDPRLKQMFSFHGNSLQEIEGDTISTADPLFELTRSEVFQD